MGSNINSKTAPRHLSLAEGESLSSGVRPSSGAASSNSLCASDFPGTASDLGAAAPEDGRTPLKRYQGDGRGEGERVAEILFRGPPPLQRRFCFPASSPFGSFFFLRPNCQAPTRPRKPPATFQPPQH